MQSNAGGPLLRCEAATCWRSPPPAPTGSAMALTCNSRPPESEVLVDDGCYAQVRERQTCQQMIAGETHGGGMEEDMYDYSESNIAKLWGGNLMRVWQAAIDAAVRERGAP